MDGKERICPVCERPEGRNERYWHHYGALCCLSCKAFFRRYANFVHLVTMSLRDFGDDVIHVKISKEILGMILHSSDILDLR